MKGHFCPSLFPCILFFLHFLIELGFKDTHACVCTHIPTHMLTGYQLHTGNLWSQRSKTHTRSVSQYLRQAPSCIAYLLTSISPLSTQVYLICQCYFPSEIKTVALVKDKKGLRTQMYTAEHHRITQSQLTPLMQVQESAPRLRNVLSICLLDFVSGK